MPKRPVLNAMPTGRLPALAAAVLLASAGGSAAAASPVPFFRGLERVGVLCALEAGAGAPALDAARLCALAVGEMAGLLGPAGPEVTALDRNDERIGDPDTLVILLHANLRSEDGLAALSAGLHRARPEAGSPPFFIAPPQAASIIAPPQAAAIPDATADADALRPAVRRLLHGVARAIQGNRLPRQSVEE